MMIECLTLDQMVYFLSLLPDWDYVNNSIIIHTTGNGDVMWVWDNIQSVYCYGKGEG